MTLRERLYFLAAGTIACTAYAATLCRRSGLALYDRVATTREWRTVEFTSLRVRVPPDWGDVERTPDGGYVVHNRPVKDRIDGDTVWYASAIELRVRRPDMPGLPRLAPMQEVTRRLETADGPILVALQVANGVGPSRRREAHRVLRSARAVTGRPCERGFQPPEGSCRRERDSRPASTRAERDGASADYGINSERIREKGME